MNAQYEMVKLGEVCAFEYGKPLKEENRVSGDYPVYGSNGIVGYHNNFLVEAPFIVVGRKGSAGSVHFSKKNGFPIDTTFFIKLKNEDRVLLKYLSHFFCPSPSSRNPAKNRRRTGRRPGRRGWSQASEGEDGIQHPRHHRPGMGEGLINIASTIVYCYIVNKLQLITPQEGMACW